MFHSEVNMSNMYFVMWIILPCFAFCQLSNFANVFTCANLLEDINYTAGMFATIENNSRLTIPEKFYMANLTCSGVTLAKKELNEDLCALEMNPDILDKKNNLEMWIDEKISMFCDKDFTEIKSKLIQLNIFLKKKISFRRIFEGMY